MRTVICAGLALALVVGGAWVGVSAQEQKPAGSATTDAGVMKVGVSAQEQKSAGPRILFLSKSAGFEHSAIRWADLKKSHVGSILEQVVAEDMGGTVLQTKDAGLVNAENLKNYDVVVFYTTGDLTQTGTDGQPAMSPEGVSDLIAWVNQGGGFIGFHSTTDTFHSEGDTPSPFIQLIGGEFLTHGKQFEGRVKVVSPEHPCTQNMPATWTMNDEWYAFRNLDTEGMHVLALLQPGEQRAEQPDKYNIPDYPIAWVRKQGEGRVYYNAMGHREDVWIDATFQKTMVDAINWAMGKGELDAAPNYHEVVPTTITEAKREGS